MRTVNQRGEFVPWYNISQNSGFGVSILIFHTAPKDCKPGHSKEIEKIVQCRTDLCAAIPRHNELEPSFKRPRKTDGSPYTIHRLNAAIDKLARSIESPELWIFTRRLILRSGGFGDYIYKAIDESIQVSALIITNDWSFPFFLAQRKEHFLATQVNWLIKTLKPWNSTHYTSNTKYPIDWVQDPRDRRGRIHRETT